ncbi:C6 zink-finger PRO1A [Fusarium mundagurra]|uniref:C6 zink-finger PRO1A n=1 Tax=Fusarium mundagurra TaxID=1567541 RepID=A0A8H5YX31_9HYPO|nr:C6 zink-finger PRO1A [Fusarium mundagurra]
MVSEGRKLNRKICKSIVARKGFAVQVQPLQQDYSSEEIKLHEVSSLEALAPIEKLDAGVSSDDTAKSARANHSTNQQETDDFLISLYLDTVFPYLFPLYRPASLAGGRAWLLKAIQEQPAIHHTVISISAYYFTLLLARDASQTLRTPCEQHVWDTLALHMDSSLKAIQEEMTAFNKVRSSSGKVDVLTQTCLLGIIVQQLIFDTAMAEGADWNLHLTAALGLFRDIIETHGQRDGVLDLDAVLQAISPRSPIFNGIHPDFIPWSQGQNAFQFFAAFLMYADVISSIMSGTAPKLQRYHGMLIAKRTACDGREALALKTEDYIGCPGSILAVLGKISAIDGSRNPRGERERQEIIELKTKLQALAETQQGLQTDQGQQVAEAWMHGAMLYLTIVEQGRRPSHTETSHHVQAIAKMLAGQLSLRSIMWPFFMAGVLAEQEDEIIFTKAVLNLGPLKAFGSAKEALRLLEQAWLARDETQQDNWRLSGCFGGENRYGLLI